MITNQNQGFTLIELMIVVAIIGILASIAIPQYNTYTKRSKFTEVVLATSPFKNAFEVAVQGGRITDLSSADTGTNGIPIATPSTPIINTITMTNGVITGTGTATVDSVDIVLTPNGVTPPIQWVSSGSCVIQAIC